MNAIEIKIVETLIETILAGIDIDKDEILLDKIEIYYSVDARIIEYKVDEIIEEASKNIIILKNSNYFPLDANEKDEKKVCKAFHQICRFTDKSKWLKITIENNMIHLICEKGYKLTKTVDDI